MQSPLIVRVLQHDFPIRRQYTAGHVLDHHEATALNQLLVENIRNNVYSWITKMARGNSALSAEDYDELLSRINEYADRYQFKSRIRSRTINPLESAIREIARQHAETWGNQFGHLPTSPEVYNKFIELKSHPSIQNEARELILRRQSVVNTALEGLAI